MSVQTQVRFRKVEKYILYLNSIKEVVQCGQGIHKGNSNSRRLISPPTDQGKEASGSYGLNTTREQVHTTLFQATHYKLQVNHSDMLRNTQQGNTSHQVKFHTTETGFPGPIRCCGWTSTGADYGVRQGTTQKKEKTPLTWDSQHVHQDIQTVPRLEGKSNHVTRSSKLTHTHTNHTIIKEQQPAT